MSYAQLIGVDVAVVYKQCKGTQSIRICVGVLYVCTIGVHRVGTMTVCVWHKQCTCTQLIGVDVAVVNDCTRFAFLYIHIYMYIYIYIYNRR